MTTLEFHKARKVWRGLRPVAPEQFARVGNAIHVVPELGDVVIVISGKDLDKLQTLIPKNENKNS